MFDAYYGPYKVKWRFWFGIRLWVLVAMLILYTILEQFSILELHFVIISLFIFVQASIKPFKNALIGWLDLFFMVNYFAVVLVLLYFYNQRDQAITIVGVLVGTTLVAFICIILYHIYLACKLRRYCPRIPRENEAMRDVVGYEPLDGSNYDHVYNAGHEDARFRETLLGSQS